MSTVPEIAVTHEPRKLGLVGKALVALMVVLTAGLGIGFGIAVRAKRIEEARERVTRSLREVRSELVDEFGPAFPSLSFDKSDPTGQARLERRLSREGIGVTWQLTPRLDSLRTGLFITDAWSHPIYCRCPGPVHKKGWDLISCGPNGVYEEGGGDDLVVGEDLPAESDK